MAEDDRDKPWERYLRRPPKPAPKRKRSLDKKALPLGGTDSVWERHRPQPKKCAICGKPFTPGKDRPPNAMTCASRECMAEYERRYARGYYTDNSAKIIDQTSASRRRRHKPIVKHCIAPHPTMSGALCGKEFEVKTTGDGRRLTCSPGVAAGDDGHCNVTAITPILRLSETIRTHTIQPTMRSRLAPHDAQTRPVAGSISSGGATNILVVVRFAIYGNKESSIATKSTRGNARSDVQTQELTRPISGSTGKPIQQNLRATMRSGARIQNMRLISGSTGKPIEKN